MEPSEPDNHRVPEEEIKTESEIYRLGLQVEKIKKEYALRIPDPNLPLLYVINRSLNPSAGLGEKWANNFSYLNLPIYPSAVIHEYGTCGLNIGLNKQYGLSDVYENNMMDDEEGLPEPSNGVETSLRCLIRSAALRIDDLSLDSYDELLRAWSTRDTEVTMWQSSNLEVRTALLWSEILSKEDMANKMAPRQAYPTRFFQLGSYRVSTEGRRLSLSPRAVTLYKQGSLDLRLPKGISPEALQGMKPDELIGVANQNPPPEGFEEEVREIMGEETIADKAGAAVITLLRTFPNLQILKRVFFVPVYYGTSGSFSNQHATLINGLTYEGKYNKKERVVQSDFDAANRFASSGTFDQRQMFGNILDAYSLSESSYKYPFMIYVRFPEKTDQIRTFYESEMPSMCVEEYLHNLIFVYSSYYKLPHAVEEYVVKTMLERAGFAHSGTSASVEDMGGEDVKNELDKIIAMFAQTPPEIKMGEFIERIVKAYYR